MRVILSALFFLILHSATAQLSGQLYIDSLIKEIPNQNNDTLTTRLYKKIVDQYANNNPAEAMHYAELGLKHVTSMKWEKGVAVFNQIIGTLYTDKGEYNKSIELLNKAYVLQVAIKDSFNAASTLNNIGLVYMRQMVLDKATKCFFDALKLAESIHNQYLVATCLGNIGNVYFSQNDYAKTLEYQFKALKILTAEDHKEGVANSYASIANTYQQKKDTINAKKYYTNAITFYTESNNSTGIATVYTNLSNLYTDLTVNLSYKLKAQKIWDELNPSHPTSLANMANIGLSYLDFARYDSLRNNNLPADVPNNKNELLQRATAYLNRGILLSQQAGDIGNFSYLTGLRAEVEAEQGNFKNAYYDIQAFHSFNDSIYSQENKNKIAAIEGQREVELRDKEIQLNKLALSAQKKQRVALIAGLGLLCIIGTLLYRQSRIRKKTNTTLLHLNNELDEANKIKAKFFGILSHDLRGPVANLINFLHLQKEAPELLSKEQTAAAQQKITTAAERLLDNMETMLLWSKEIGRAHV